MPFGNVPKRGWHTWVAIAVMVSIGLIGIFLYWGLNQ